jgi:hypothetical protein
MTQVKCCGPLSIGWHGPCEWHTVDGAPANAAAPRIAEDKTRRDSMRDVWIGSIVIAGALLALAPKVAHAHAGSDSSLTVRDVLTRYVEAVGGSEAVERLVTKICRGSLVHDVSWHDPPHEEIPFEGYGKLGGKVLIVEHVREEVRREGTDGVASWVQDAGALEIGESSIPIKMAWLCDPRSALRIAEYFPGLVVARDAHSWDRPTYALVSPELKAAHYTLYFDAETGLLVRIGYYWELQDYREVDGVKIPHRIVISRKGGSSTLILDEVKHNLSLPDSIFAPPQPRGGEEVDQ